MVLMLDDVCLDFGGETRGDEVARAENNQEVDWEWV